MNLYEKLKENYEKILACGGDAIYARTYNSGFIMGAQHTGGITFEESRDADRLNTLLYEYYAAKEKLNVSKASVNSNSKRVIEFIESEEAKICLYCTATKCKGNCKRYKALHKKGDK